MENTGGLLWECPFPARELKARAVRKGCPWFYLGRDAEQRLVLPRGAPHHWRAGDIFFWDDRATMYRADHAGPVGDRVLHRGLVLGDAPAAG